MKSYKLYVFDLDNTLYDEHEFLAQAYQNIAYYLAQQFSLISQDKFYDFLWTYFLNRGREKLLDQVLQEFNLQSSQVTLEHLLAILHNTAKDAKLTLYPWVKDCFQRLLEAQKRIVILTNGHLEQQQNKVQRLDLLSLLEPGAIYYSAQLGYAKPAPEGLLAILRSADVAPSQALMVGDHEVDFLSAQRAEVDFIYIQDFIKEIEAMVK